MKIERPEIVVKEMNRCAASKIPFLFAFDFEIENAFFIENPLEQQKVLFRTPLGGNSL